VDDIKTYIEAGWSVVPITAGKNPGFPGWEQRGSALRVVDGQVVTWDGHAVNPAWGVGVMHAYTGTMAFDIDDEEETIKYGIDVVKLRNAPDAVTIDSGRKNRGKLLYRMPFGLKPHTKQYKIRVPSEEDPKRTKSKTVFEMRCATSEGTTVQDVLPPTIHPDTGKPYRWGGKGHWSRLPMIPDQLLKVWLSLSLVPDVVHVESRESSIEEIVDALSYIDADCAYEDWRNVGMALRWYGDRTMDSDKAFEMWDEWSQGAPKRYPANPREMEKLWNSFRSNKKGSLVTLGTLFSLARQDGWVRKTPDVAALFAGDPVAPVDITNVLKPPAPEVDLSLFPPILARRAQEVSDSVGCDPLVPLWAGLAAASGAMDARTRLELVDGWKVPPVLWLMTIGDPAAKKSPGSSPMIEPLEAIEAEDAPRFKQALTDFQAQEIMHATAFNAWSDFLKTADVTLPNAVAPKVPEKPAKPAPVRIIVQDINSPSLARLAEERPQGYLCHLDEMNGWARKLCARDGSEDRSTWVQSYESKRFELQRVGAGRVSVENLAVSIYGNIQPRVLAESMDALSADGLLQRFLPAVVRDEYDRIGNPRPAFLTSAAKWDTTLRALFVLPVMTYRMTPEAYVVFRRFNEWYQDQKKNERLMRSSDTFLTAFGKLEGLVGRLILVFHAIETPYEPSIQPELVDRVVKLARQYILPAYRYLFDEEGSMSSFDIWLTDHIIQHADKPTITSGAIRSSARRQFEKAKLTNPMAQSQWIMSGMYALEQRHWVARADDGGGEHKGNAEWHINPELVKMFSDYRKAVIRAKESRRAEIREKVPEGSRHKNGRVHGSELLEGEQ
jgi:hypothetical protein